VQKEVPALLERMLPHQPTSPNALPPPQIALSFLAGVIAGADKLPRVAHLRADPAGRAILLSPPTPISGVFCYRGQLSAESNQRNVLRLRDHAASTGPRSIERGIEEARTKSFSVTTRLLMQLNTVDSATNGLISSIKSDPNAGRPKRGW